MRRILTTALLLSIALEQRAPIRAQATDAAAPPAVKVLDVVGPKDLKARAAANVPRVDLHWTDNVDGEAGYVIERSADGGNAFAEIARVGTNAARYADHAVERDTAHAYRVRAVGQGWETAQASADPARTADFQVFDGTLFQRKPNLRRTGIDPIYVAYAHEFSASAQATFDHAGEGPTRAMARRAKRRGIVVIDIEHWPLDIRKAPREEVSANLRKLAQIVDWIRDESPQLKVGFYGVIPLDDYWTPVRFLAAQERIGDARNPAELTKLRAEYDRWVEANDFVRAALGEKIDFVFPSLYTFYEDYEGWAKYARASIEQAKRSGRPVHPFLMMHYHDSNKDLAGRQLPAELWSRQTFGSVPENGGRRRDLGRLAACVARSRRLVGRDAGVPGHGAQSAAARLSARRRGNSLIARQT